MLCLSFELIEWLKGGALTIFLSLRNPKSKKWGTSPYWHLTANCRMMPIGRLITNVSRGAGDKRGRKYLYQPKPGKSPINDRLCIHKRPATPKTLFGQRSLPWMHPRKQAFHGVYLWRQNTLLVFANKKLISPRQVLFFWKPSLLSHSISM